jgi:hypothetical protein
VDLDLNLNINATLNIDPDGALGGKTDPLGGREAFNEPLR